MTETQEIELHSLPTICINRSKALADFTVENYNISVSSHDPQDLIVLLDECIKRMDKMK